MGDIVGPTLGSSVGALDGEVEGRIEPLIDGVPVGFEVGDEEGRIVPEIVGPMLTDGCAVDKSVGVILILGVEDGNAVGSPVGATEGDVLGTPEGAGVPPSPVQKPQVFTHALPIS